MLKYVLSSILLLSFSSTATTTSFIEEENIPNERVQASNVPSPKLTNIKELRRFFYKGRLEITPQNCDILSQHSVLHNELFYNYDRGIHVKQWPSSLDYNQLLDLLLNFNHVAGFKISVLWQGNNDLTELLAKPLQFYENLTELDLSGCHLTANNIKDVVESLPFPERLKVLNVKNNALGSSVLTELGLYFNTLTTFLTDHEESNLSTDKLLKVPSLSRPLESSLVREQLTEVDIPEKIISSETLKPNMVVHYLYTLPKEVLTHIFSFIHPRAIKGVLLTSKQFNALLEEGQPLWDIWQQSLNLPLNPQEGLSPTFLPINSLPTATVKSQIYYENAFIAELRNERAFKEIWLKKAADLNHSGLMQAKIQDLGKDNYTYNLKQGDDIIESLIAEENTDIASQAAGYKFGGLSQGLNGYPKSSHDELREYIEKLVALGNRVGVVSKVNNLATGQLGYPEDPKAARNLLEHYIAQKKEWAIEIKLKQLIGSGDCRSRCYAENFQEGQQMIEESVRRREFIGISSKLNGLEFGSYSYAKNLNEARNFREQLIAENIIYVIRDKMWALGNTIEMHGYQPNPIAARAFVEEMTLREPPIGPHIKLQKVIGLLKGLYGYDKNKNAGRKYFEELIAQEDMSKINLFNTYFWGPSIFNNLQELYEDPGIIRNIVEKLISKNQVQVMENKLVELAKGGFVYPKDLHAARLLNDKLIQQGNKEALFRKAKLLRENDPETNYYYYTREDLKLFLEYLVRQGDTHAIREMAQAIFVGNYGYEQDPNGAVDFIEELIAQGSKNALAVKMEALIEGKYGFIQNLHYARDIIEELVSYSHPEGIKKKIEGFAAGQYGYQRNPLQAHALNETLVSYGDREAMKRKAEGLSTGSSGYTKSPNKAREFINGLVSQEVQEGYQLKIQGLAEGLYDYQKDPKAAHRLNEQRVIYGDREAIRRKIEGLIKQKYGYTQDFEQAIMLIKQYNIVVG